MPRLNELLRDEGNASASDLLLAYTANGTRTKTVAEVVAGASAPVTSVAGRTGAVTLASTDVSGLGTAATKNTGEASGVCDLDSNAKVPANRLPDSVVGPMMYQGTWNATTNSPAIPAAASGNKGHVYKVATAGTTDIDGIASWAVGDWIVSNGTTWDKIDNTDSVTSVAGRTGAVTIAAADITDGTTVGRAVLKLTNPGAISFPRFNADNSVDALDAASFRTAIGAGAGTGDVAGPASSTDNTLPRFDGSGGKTIQGSGVVVSDANAISGFAASINFQTGTSYSMAGDADTGKIVDHANASAIAVTLPANASVGTTLSYVQSGAGQITFSVASGGTLHNADGHTKTAKQWAAVQLYVRANSGGSAAEWVMTGYTAA